MPKKKCEHRKCHTCGKCFVKSCPEYRCRCQYRSG